MQKYLCFRCFCSNDILVIFSAFKMGKKYLFQINLIIINVACGKIKIPSMSVRCEMTSLTGYSENHSPITSC